MVTTPSSTALSQVGKMFRAQFIKDLSFENPGSYFKDPAVKPELDINITLRNSGTGQDMCECQMRFEASAKQGDKTLFLVDLTYAGVVSFEGIDDQDLRNRLINVDVPHFLFPFARAVMSSLTQEGGYPALMVAPVDFASMYEARQQQGQAQTAEAAEDKVAEIA